MIEGAVKEVIGNGCGLKIVISVPDGKALGEKTFNPKLGIIGVSLSLVLQALLDPCQKMPSRPLYCADLTLHRNWL